LLELRVTEKSITSGAKKISLTPDKPLCHSSADHREKAERLYIKFSELCNLKCPYCYQADHTHVERNINLADYQKMLAPYLSDACDIFLFGGEPLLDFNMTNLTQWFSMLPPARKVMIFTNGCFSPAIRPLLRQHRSHIAAMMITLDGPETIHNARRGAETFNAYQAIVGNIEYLYQNGFPVTLQVNVDGSNTEHILPLLDSLSQRFLVHNMDIWLNKVLHSAATLGESDYLHAYVEAKRQYPNLKINSVVLRKLRQLLIRGQYDRRRCLSGFTHVLDFQSGLLYTCPQNSASVVGRFNERGIELSEDSLVKYRSLAFKYNEKCDRCPFVYVCQYGCCCDGIPAGDSCRMQTEEEVHYILRQQETFFSPQELAYIDNHLGE
jgi:radical SAM protein with 4Fe4S-binding SPASM domain